MTSLCRIMIEWVKISSPRCLTLNGQNRLVPQSIKATSGPRSVRPCCPRQLRVYLTPLLPLLTCRSVGRAVAACPDGGADKGTFTPFNSPVCSAASGGARLLARSPSPFDILHHPGGRVGVDGRQARSERRITTRRWQLRFVPRQAGKSLRFFGLAAIVPPRKKQRHCAASCLSRSSHCGVCGICTL